MKETYVQILIDSLKRKNEVLIQLIELSKKQTIFINSLKDNEEDFNNIIDEKAKLIDTLNLLDSGFDKTFERVKVALQMDKALYKKEIEQMQKLIVEITSNSTKLQTIEARNKASMDMYFANKKGDIKKGRMGTKAAANYYKNMADKHQNGQSYFFNKIK